MEDSSSDGSIHEEEVLRNFDEEAKIIVQTETISKKSSDRYVLVYNTYKKWREENRHSLSSSEENNLIVYFENLKTKLKPPTLWSIWSMLKKTLSMKDDINISNFLNLKSIIKTNAKGYKPKKAFVLRWNQITQFMNEAPNDKYLAMKVILTFGICGCLRCDEITNIKVDDVEDLNDKYLVSINYNKNDYSGQFIIGNLFYDKVKKYISLRPHDKFSERFFIKYSDGKCGRQPIGRHAIGAVPEKIASYLNLPNSKRDTGHCFRRSSATLLSDSGANMQMVKQLGRWRSDMIAQGYIENSMHNRQMIYDGIIQKTTENAQSKPSKSAVQKTAIEIQSKPSTSAQTIIDPENNADLHFDWTDFDDDYTIDDIDQPSTKLAESGFTTARKNPILVPITTQNASDIGKKKLFFEKPGIKLTFKDQSTVEPPPNKKRNVNRDFTAEDNDDLNVALEKRDLKFYNCTFTNCVFNVTSCSCKKE